ncbi:MAG: hypothetical protein K2X91_16215, partial [Thermoleophilia bacterium]|nr:hypothetical protein [Thermoleophilia bacterium]
MNDHRGPAGDGQSRLYLITSEARRRKTVLRGIVREVRETRPDDELLGDPYRDHAFPAWWRIDETECVAVPDFDALALRMTDGKPYDTAWLSVRQPFNYLRQACAWPDAADATDTCDLGETTAASAALVAPLMLPQEPVFPSHAAAAPPARMTIHAVDWSGGGEFGSANAKIRYARWETGPTGSAVAVLPPALSRGDILRMARATPGLWVFDFPFGLPAELLRRAGVRTNDLDATLGFTRGIPKNDFRDRCNRVWDLGPDASKRRATERAVGGGWFDWFVQLFRQTWTGQAEILSALRAEPGGAALLPWDHDRAAATRLVEGFPGASLRHRGLPADGYKHATGRARGVRETIVSGLVARGLPLTDEVQR